MSTIQTVEKNQIVNNLVKVFRGNEVNLYNSSNECRQIFCGWCGTNSPLSRPAYIADFGLDVVVECENKARAIIEDDRIKYEASEYHSFEIEADKHKANGQPAPAENSFMWAIHSGLKCDGGDGIYNELNYKLYDENGQHIELVKIEKVYNVSLKEFEDPGTADQIASREDCPGGGCKVDGDYLDKDKMCFTYAGAVIAPDGRYYLVNNEGFSYARYILTSLSWREMFAKEIEQIKEQQRKEAEAEALQEAKEREERLKEYNIRCAKWANLMTDITEYKEDEEKARIKYGYASKEYRAAERKLHNIRRSNILSMCRGAFPGVKFSLKKNSGWGSDWVISWEDGPSVKTFNEKTNLELFSTYHDTFNGYDDSTGVSYEEFTEFAYKYMGSCNSIETERNMSSDKRLEIIQEIINIVPEFDIKNSYGYYSRYTFDNSQAEALQNYFNMGYYDLFGNFSDTTAEELARRVWFDRDYFQEEIKKEIVLPVNSDQKNIDLKLIDYSEKAIAVIGNTRDYVDKLKELGGRFNAKLKCGAGWIFSKKRETELRKAFCI